MRVLVVNAGSSSLKLRLLSGDDEVKSERDLPPPDEDAGDLERALGELGSVDAVGHRVVHGGDAATAGALIDHDLVAELRSLTDLAPLHQPKSLGGIEAVARTLPGIPAVACFDTAFHATMDRPASTYPLPRSWRDRWPLKRFGFHGLSHAYASRRAAEMLDRSPDDLRVVVCHLGAGASLAAVHAGKSIDTTMGFTPLEGLMMATRSGSIDPGLVLWLLERTTLSVDDVKTGLEKQSGLVGLAGTSDMRTVLAKAGSGDQDALLALDLYVHRLRAGIAAMAASLGGLDAVVFTGGVGEHSPEIRARAATGLGFLGIALDESRNAESRGDHDITQSGAPVRSLVVEAREDLEIARITRSVLS